MTRYTFTVKVAAPPSAVYDLWTNLDRTHEWVEGVTKLTDVTGPYGEAGTTYTLWFGPTRSRCEVIEAERPRHIRTKFHSFQLAGESEVSLEPDGASTILTQTFEVHGLIPRIAARVFATGSYRGSFRGELNTFVRIAEREAGR